jgi:putative sigma-54 modulation protein
MRIGVRARRLTVPPRLAQDVDQRLRLTVGRFARRVSAVAVRLFDVNGPRGGLDKVCEVTVSLSRAGTVRYRAVASSVAVAASRALAGTQEVIARRLALRRDRRRQDGRRRRELARETA